MKHAPTQQIELAATVHRALHELELVDPTSGLPLAVGPGPSQPPPRPYMAMYPEGSGDLGVLHAFLRKGVDRFEELLRLLSRAFLRSFAVQAEVRQPP